MENSENDSSLSGKLANLDAIKKQIWELRCNCSCTCCCTRNKICQGIVSLGFTPTVDQIGSVINFDSNIVCSWCTQLINLNSQLDAAKLDVYNTINSTYNLTAETSPFSI